MNKEKNQDQFDTGDHSLACEHRDDLSDADGTSHFHKNKGEAAYMNVSLPSEWHPENYITVLEKDFIRSLGNSVFITFISVALIVSLSAFLSFIIVRREYKRMQDRV